MHAEPAISTQGKILVIDDNPIIQRTVYFALRDKGYKVLMSGEIEEALVVVRHERPDLIILDINFPLDVSVTAGGQRDGFWTIGWLQHMEEAKGVPVIIISGDDPVKTGPRALAAGAAAFFHKPINREELVTAVNRLLSCKVAA